MNQLENNWHLKLFKKSIVKQAKLRALLKFLPPCEGRSCLDLGGDNGVISSLLRQRGGTWHSGDLTAQAVESIRSIVRSDVFQTDGRELPFSESSLDLAVIIDFLEHIPHDRQCIEELHRVLKPGAVLIVHVPHIKKGSAIRRIRNLLGLTDEQHGHLRPGYSVKGMRSLLGGEFRVTDVYTYSRFFTELLDIAIARACATSAPETGHGSKGLLITETQLKKMKRQFTLYSMLYPLMWLFSRLDALLFFTKGHRLVIRAEKNPASGFH